VDEVVIRPGVPQACRALSEAGALLIVVTNQPDLARGTASRADVDAINDHFVAELGLDEVCVCPHDDADGCGCRKPLPGLLVDAAERHGVDLGRSFMVGDRWRDVEAGARAGVTTVWVRSDYRERLPEAPDHVVDGLAGVVDLVRQSLQLEEEPQR
jgi:D-glycero-D-manno-heptose 1,7-bisphosphate phosphatase